MTQDREALITTEGPCPNANINQQKLPSPKTS